MQRVFRIIRNIFITSLFLVPILHAPVAMANIASVDYIHQTITNLKSITLPIPDGTAAERVTNVRYLMKQIDDANTVLNGTKVTDYASGDLSKINIVAAEKARQDIENLIQILPSFNLELTGVSSFDFKISAAGNFIIVWGDGTLSEIKKTDTTDTTYSHTYPKAGNYTVRIRGSATAYSSSNVAAISFAASTNKTKITGINGDLSRIFGTINGKNGRFMNTFEGCSGITSLPNAIWGSLTGDLTNHIFYYTFKDCTGLRGPIPDKLFGNLNGKAYWNMFQSTFQNCSGLTGPIPDKLFGTITGTPQSYMFAYTFDGCSNLEGPIPAGLFGNLTGKAMGGMYLATFRNCSKLGGSIPAGLFGTPNSAPAANMFQYTFTGCENLSGSIPTGLFGTISGAPASYMYADTFSGCSGLTGPIPSGLFGTINGPTKEGSFYRTFTSCSGLTGKIPTGLLGTFTGAPVSNLFGGAFKDCSGLTGFEDGIWDLTGMTTGTNSWWFGETFSGCTSLTGASPSTAPGSTEKLWTKFGTAYWMNTFRGSTGLSDYSSIPGQWR